MRYVAWCRLLQRVARLDSRWRAAQSMTTYPSRYVFAYGGFFERLRAALGLLAKESKSELWDQAPSDSSDLAAGVELADVDVVRVVVVLFGDVYEQVAAC